ncbi:hypothetical protein [Nocardiopsis quinghaiensis]|uniref:hypothetical protein n=1 Tax=Nocardiopsis quinghaiensis TaxID=464995 RepID=UPI00123855EA|nr:hypothetical protein [Nocardiopsis quinghaiensis]
MKFELVEPPDWEDPPQAAHDEQEPPHAAGPVRAAAGHARDRFRVEAGALQAVLGRMWQVISSAQDRESALPATWAVAPGNFRPGAFSSRDA